MLGDAGRPELPWGTLSARPIHLEEMDPSFPGVVGPEDLKVNLIVLEGKARQDYLRESKVILLVLEDLEESKAVL